MKEKLEQIKNKVPEALAKCGTLDEIQELDVRILGRKGELTEILTGLKDVPADQKPILGKLANDVKKELEAAFATRREVVEKESLSKALTDEWIDLTAPGRAPEMGSVHPLSQTQYEVETIFNSMGFTVADGLEVESEYYNFDALNVPGHHPARDMQDTFFLDKETDPKFGKLLLRTQTSPGQVRNMLKYGAPIRIIIPGRVFRNEALDATHEHTFDQVEGLLVDENISIASLKGVMREFLTKLFKKEVKVRFRPGYFPFVEPGFELDFSCLLCDGTGKRNEIENEKRERGCRTCKGTGWVEFMGAGMVHPFVLKSGGIDPKKYQGWAFGFGLDRLLMMRYKIEDIRHLRSGDLRFVEQFH